MAGVPQKTLNWLYDVLRREYRDPNRAYSDIAQTLAQYSSFSPRTDVYTSENGIPALLLNLKGTVPVNFRGTIYRFPIVLWIPHAYPHEAPVVYVTPTEDMMVRQGQHVSGADGKVYHHYLSQWTQAWDRSNVVELLKLLADIFAREPPVMARQQAAMSRHQPQGQGPLPIPPQRHPPGVSGQIQAGPPPPPPKQPASGGPASPAPPPQSRYDAPPPLPKDGPGPRPQSTYANGHMSQPQAGTQYVPQRQSSRNYQQPPRQPMPQQYQPQSPANSMSSPAPHPQPHPVQPYQQRGQTPIQHNYQQPPYQQPTPQGPPQSQPHPQQQPQQYQQNPQQQRLPPHSQPPYQQPTPQAQQPLAQQKPPPPKDLLSDSDPFQLPLPTSTTQNQPSHHSAPPIPPINPEKTALLSHLSHLILQSLHTSIRTSTSALPSLTSQSSALTTAHSTLSSELQALSSLQSQLNSNISSLQSTLTQSSSLIQTTKSPNHANNPSSIPGIDDIIIPPSVIARQLYDCVAEQRGYEAAIYALNEGFVRGRIGGEVWGRRCREMAREEFRRKWMVRRISKGLGLEGT